MSNSLKLGLGNTVQESTLVFHGGITTRDSFGRITDLVAVWIKKEHSISQKKSGDLRVLIQGLLEFGFPEKKSSVGHLELAIENNTIYVGLRFENFIVNENDDIEKALAQFWLNSDESTLLKRILYPQDRVEVRFMKKLNALEWRIIRPIAEDAINLEASSFQVIAVEEEGLSGDHKKFVEMGDVHYDDWISEVYQNAHDKNKSGELFQNGESVQGEEEWARIVSDHDMDLVDQTVQTLKTNASETDSSVTIQSEAQNSDNEHKSSFNSETDVLKEKVKQLELLLKKKEKQNQKLGMEISNLQNKVNNVISVAQNTDAKQIQAFRDKALQMFEKAKALQLEKQNLEKVIFELKRGAPLSGAAGNAAGAGSPNEAPGLLLQIEEMKKKADALSRALEAEKQKIKPLLDRALLAEKEAQSSTPIIAELERKVETSLKMAQQHKKESEQVKLKLVQSEAEKNKIKNDLIKAQAQIQTLIKRQAS